MSLYYQDDYVTLYHGDCLEHLDYWLDADVLVTDPPYGMKLKSGRFNGKVGGFGDLTIAGDADTTVRDAALDAWGTVRPGLAFGRWSIERPKGTKQVLIWEKGDHTGMGDLDIPWRPSTEEIYVIGKWPKRPNAGRGGGGRVAPVYRVMAPTPGKENGRLHATEKPVPLMERLIEKCPPGVIAEPFAGSGATLVAAKNLGRKVIGVELEEKHCETIAKRCAQEVLNIFGGAV
jgi:site-specific DNA-methyltransferase (adenine-specific)